MNGEIFAAADELHEKFRLGGIFVFAVVGRIERHRLEVAPKPLEEFVVKTVDVVTGRLKLLEKTLPTIERVLPLVPMEVEPDAEEFKGLVDAAEKRENIIFILEAQIASIDGSDNVKHITVNYKDGRKETLDVSALFIAIGHVPVNDIFRKFTDLDEEGYADNGEDCSTYTPGFFTAGDCRKKEVRQLTTAAADGAVAALAACRYIDSIS